MFNESDILHYLDENAITYQRLEHPPVYTCEDADRVRPILAGEHIKNIFSGTKAASTSFWRWHVARSASIHGHWEDRWVSINFIWVHRSNYCHFWA
ncbi:MAG: hypothetical protein ABSA51_00050 [Anaerolineaceae bacterium]|jgi:hypothetical protein